MTGEKNEGEELSDQEVADLIGEAPCASRPAPKTETLAEYLARIAREDNLPEDKP